MKNQNKKNRIIIPQLIKKIKPKEENKENLQTYNQTNNFTNHIENKLKISQFLDDSSDNQSNKEELQSTNRITEDPDSQIIHTAMLSQPKKKGSQLTKMQGLLRSERMFVNPDKWNQFLQRASNDEKFQKALNIFMYSYFIQNYN